MSEVNGSPRRRHILSSINPDVAPGRHIKDDDYDHERGHAREHEHKRGPHDDEVVEPKKKHSRRRSRSRSPGSSHRTEERKAEDGNGENDPEDRTRPRRSRLKLKDHRSSRRRHRSRSRSRHLDEDERSHRHGHRSSRRRHRRHRSPTPPNPFDETPLDPEAAFRESLFDAMADEEGADYWAAVYGQPVHVYNNERVGPEGELERMTDEEYAAHVRQKMWEKTHAGLLEERARREEVRKAKAEEEKRQRRVQRDVEESLRRGEERRSRKKWETMWEEYEAAWAAWDGTPASLTWPTETGKREGIDDEAVRTFLVRGLRLEEVGETKFVARLKDERVRWHPDKIQQRAGGTVDEETMRDVTAIFQIIDRLWGQMRTKAKG